MNITDLITDRVHENINPRDINTIEGFRWIIEMIAIEYHREQLTISDVSNSLLELKKYSIDEIENYLDTIGYSIIKTTELDYLEEKLMNYPG